MKFTKMGLLTFLVLSFATLTLGQRPFFAGQRPIGYPEVTTEALADRFGEVDGTTQRLPVEANGDRDLVDRLSKLPVDKQPFWFINWQALEAHRQNPQTYPQKPNPFVDPIQSNGGSNSANFNGNNGNINPGNVIPNSANVNPNSGNINSNAGINPGNVNSSSGNGNSNSGSVATDQNAFGFVSANRFGVEEHPNNQDPIENAFTNSNTGSVNSNSGGKVLSDKKKSPSKNTKDHHAFHY